MATTIAKNQFLGHADDRVVVGAELDRLADRVLVGEEGLGGLGGEHGVVLVLVVVGGGEEPAAVDLQQVELGVVVRRADDAAVEVVIEAADLLADLADRQRLLDRRHGGHDPVVVVVLQPVVEDPRGPAAGRPGPRRWA